jgi:hypothetical protein
MVLEVSTNAGHDLVPAARDKLDLRVAKRNVNLCRATVAGTVTARHQPGHKPAIVPLLGMRLAPELVGVHRCLTGPWVLG